MSDLILFDVADGVATITLNRPDKLNALMTGLTKDLLKALKTCARDDSIRCVVITGAGRGFSAGQDLEEILKVEGPWTVGDHLRHGYNRIALSMRELEKPIIGKINGVAAGAGLGIALATDLRIASDKARFTAAFIGIGLAPDTGVSWFLHQLAGPTKAFELLATGRMVEATEAERIGLVNQVVPHAELAPTVHALSRQLAAAPTKGIGLTKRVLNRASGLSLAEALEYEAQIQDIAISTSDFSEGVQAFLQKRKPQFKGR